MMKVIVPSPICVRLFATPWMAASQASLSLTISRSLPKFMSIELVMPSNHLILCHSLRPQSFPASKSFPMSQFFASGGWRIGVSALASVLPMNSHCWFPLGWTGWISLQSKGLSGVFSGTTVSKHQFFSGLPSLWSNSHIHAWLTGKTIVLTTWTFVRKVMSLPFRFAIAFLSRSNCLLISWLQSPSAVILEPKKR